MQHVLDALQALVDAINANDANAIQTALDITLIVDNANHCATLRELYFEMNDSEISLQKCFDYYRYFTSRK